IRDFHVTGVQTCALPILVRAMPLGNARALRFSRVAQPAADYYTRSEAGEVLLMRRGETLVAMSALKIAGLHNALNALAALAIGEIGRASCRERVMLCVDG